MSLNKVNSTELLKRFSISETVTRKSFSLCGSFILLLISLLLQSCEATRHLENGEQLIKNKPRFMGNRSLSTEEIATAVKSKPNRRLGIPKAYLHLYNLGLTLERDTSAYRKYYRKLDKTEYLLKPVYDWLINVGGEEPQLINEAQLVEDAKNIESYYYAKGFWHAKVQYEILTEPYEPRKANIRFRIKEGTQYVIQNVDFDCPDSTMALALRTYRFQSHLKKGTRYDEDKLSEERNRISSLMRNLGYYRFSPKNVSYVIDSSLSLIAPPTNDSGKRRKKNITPPNTRPLHITTRVRDSLGVYSFDSITVQVRHYADDTTFISFYPPALSESMRKDLRLSVRACAPKHRFRFLVQQSIFHNLNFNTLATPLTIYPSRVFDANEVANNQQRLQELGIFQNAIIRIRPNDTLKTLSAFVDLTMESRYSFKIGFESFQTDNDIRIRQSNLPGLGGNLLLGQKNAFRRAGRLELQTRGNVNFYKNNLDEWQSFYQYGLRLNFTIPRLLFFEKLQAYLMDRYRYKFYNPQTIFSVAYNRDQPVDFTRTSTTFDLEYRWMHTSTGREFSSFTLLNFSLINSRFDEDNLITNVLGLREGVIPTPAQLQTIVFILRDLNPRFNSILGYNRTHSFKYGQSRKSNSWYFRWGGDIGGILPLLTEQIVHRFGTSDTSLNDDIIQFSSSIDTRDRQAYNYGKFLRFTAEWKYFIPLSEKTEIVLRAYGGYAPLLFNSRIIPFEYRFYSGGTNSIRGWQSGTLGPGRADPDLNRIFPTGGDYKVELNAEYRRDFIKPLELAFLIDAGNVWASGRDTLADSNEKLSIANLRLGIAAGLGLRFDFSFLVIRLDIGQQIYSPFLNEWLFIKPQTLTIGNKYIQYNLGIGYPF